MGRHRSISPWKKRCYVWSGHHHRDSHCFQMTAVIEALSFLGPRGPVARETSSCIYYDSKHAAGVCLGAVEARTHVQLALACQQCQASNTSDYSLPCSTFTDIQEIWVTNVPIMPPRLVHLALFPITTSPLAGFIATLISLPVVVIVTTLVKSWKSCVRYLKKGARVLSNPLIELLFHGQICGVFVLFVEEIDLAKIALSCHFCS